MRDQERKSRGAGADGETDLEQTPADHHPGLLSEAEVAKRREAAEHGKGSTDEDVVAAVSSVTVAPDHGQGARIYITLSP
jgi:hypothetical protein